MARPVKFLRVELQSKGERRRGVFPWSLSLSLFLRVLSSYSICRHLSSWTAFAGDSTTLIPDSGFTCGKHPTSSKLVLVVPFLYPSFLYVLSIYYLLCTGCLTTVCLIYDLLWKKNTAAHRQFFYRESPRNYCYLRYTNVNICTYNKKVSSQFLKVKSNETLL